MPRGDAPIVRYLAGLCDLDTALEWQEPPYLLLPEVSIADLVTAGHDWSGSLEHLPWEDIVLDVGDILSLIDGADERTRHAWIRVRTVEEARSVLRRSSPWLRRDTYSEWMGSRDEERWLVVEYWDEYIISREANEPYVIILDRWHPLGKGTGGLEDPEDRRIYDASRLATGILSVFADPPLYVVEERKRLSPREMRRSGPQLGRRLNQKPWAREDLPQMILLDPSRVDEYGHPSTTAVGDPGRAPTSLHRRRGHWRRLPADEDGNRPLDDDGSPQRTWVRPAWVGAEHWDHGGHTYQLAQMPAAVAIDRARRMHAHR